MIDWRIMRISLKIFSDKTTQHRNVSQDLGFWVLSGIIVGLYLLLTYISDQYIFGNELYLRSYSDQLNRQRIVDFLDMQARYRWAGYILTPFILTIKFLFTTVCISVGLILLKFDFQLKKVFKVVILSELIFIVAKVIYVTNLWYHYDSLVMSEMADYYPLTALSYFGAENVVTWLHYPLQTLNLFEVFYITAISWLLSKQWKPDFVESLSIVLPSYATGLILWLALVTFLTIQVS
ncbi:hypothetical protein NC796_18205 [Aliifodinibius sp. S!AR15-10]|uniref:hypothetical protein n=1 Tax=Aliifodinibius sp. S!AR15-10 TaxID=2950437 RepID=UPI002854F865|nr:hypothetical protein [Aliifodinibius sp. S!AR15-10]MDR8393095.1 hypothetical protein [Aliifodinibius sp. S!AR15-10]